MADFPFDVVAFDLDGTLADTAPDLTAALNHALGALGRRAVAAETVRTLVGHGSRAMLRRALEVTGTCDEDLVERGFPLLLDFYAAHICVGTRKFDGLEDALDVLAARGVALAICTNKFERLARQLVTALGWDDRFASIVGGDTLPVRKPDPAPLFHAIGLAGGGRAAFVGDSITDTLTAKAAKLPCVAVSFGFSDRPVEELGADVLIDGFDTLVGALEGLAERVA